MSTPGVINLLISGSSAVLSLIAQYFANPSIGGVTIECTAYKESSTADVSKKMILDVNQGKQYLTDNIAPMPREWTLTGYLAPTPLEVSSLSPLLQPTLKLQKDLLTTIFYSRQLTLFSTKNHEETLFVGLSSLSFDSDPTITNRIPVTVTVQEVNVLYSQTNPDTAGVPSGMGNGSASALGNGAGKVSPMEDRGLGEIFSGINGIVTKVKK